MTFTLDQFAIQKKKVDTTLQLLAYVLNDLQQSEDANKINLIRKQLVQDSFQIVVVGEFGRGKSMFINALLGKAILPSSPIQTTAILNHIKYEESPSFLLHYNKGDRTEYVTEEEFRNLVAPRKVRQGDVIAEKEYEQSVEKLNSIKFAEIGYPYQFGKNGVTIIDTPGINDINPISEQITNGYIPQADAAIVLLTASKILTKTEMNFIKKRILENEIQKVFFVINFKDDLENEEQENKVLQLAKKELLPIFPDLKLYMISSKEALKAKRKANGENLDSRRGPINVWELQDTGILEFEKDLAHFLEHERGSIKLKKPMKSAQKIIDQIVHHQIPFERNALTTSTDQLHEKVKELRGKLLQFRKIQNDAYKTLEHELYKEENKLQLWYSGELTKVMSEGLESFDANKFTISLDELPSTVEGTIAPLERTLFIEKSQKVEKAVQVAFDYASRNLNEEWVQFDSQFQQIFGHNTEAITNLAEMNIHMLNDSMIVFEDLIDELIIANRESDSVLGKIVTGLGLGLTYIADSSFRLFSSIFSSIFGNDKTTKMRNEINKRLSESKRNKAKAFQDEWNSLTGGVKEQFRNMITQQIEKKEKQLQFLIDNTQLEENEITDKMNTLKTRETQLMKIYNDFTKFEKELDIKNPTKQEVF